jgi:hypothetical protein
MPGLRSPDQFRPGPPPRLDSLQYAAAFSEVKEFGRVDSVVRTPDQSLYAVWWMEFAETSVNRLARQLATQRRLHLWQAARLFALLNTSLYDGYVAVWDSKYEYNHWRAYTAIREAVVDGNPATAPDPTWEPLRTTPPFPEYVSAHATGTKAAMDILARTFGDNVSFTMATTTAPPENADAFVPQLQCRRGGVRRFAHAAGLAFPVCYRCWVGAWPCDSRLAR